MATDGDVLLSDMRRVAARAGDVASLDDGAAWHVQADDVLRRWDAWEQGCSAELQRLKDAQQQADSQAATRPWWQRLFKTKDQKSANKAKNAYVAKNADVYNFAGSLKKLRDSVPKDEQSKKLLIAKLKADKKALTIQKKDLALNLRGVRSTARRESVEAGSNLSALMFDSKTIAAKRKSIASNREEAVKPLEEQKHAIESEIVNIDRRIIYLESLD